MRVDDFKFGQRKTKRFDTAVRIQRFGDVQGPEVARTSSILSRVPESEQCAPSIFATAESKLRPKYLPGIGCGQVSRITKKNTLALLNYHCNVFYPYFF